MELNLVRRPLIVGLAFLVLGFVWMTLVMPGSVAALPDAPTGNYWFNPQQLSGHTLTYTMTTTGSIHVQTPDDPGRTATVHLSADVRVSFGQPDENKLYPLTLNIFNVEAEGFPEDFAAGLSNTTVRGHLSSRGAITDLSTPGVLSRIGMDSMDLFSGLFVPGPDEHLDLQSQWDVNLSRLHLGATRTRTIPVSATYLHQGTRDWGARPLQFVTNRTRGNASWLDGAARTEVLEVGSGLFYVDPETGHTAISSVSKITSIDITEQRIGTVQTRNTLTTTLELLDPPPSPVQSTDSTDSTEAVIDPEIFEEPPWLYEDPAGRFEIELPVSWRSAQVHLALRSTTLVADHADDAVYVHVLPLPSSGAGSLTIARLALTTYQEIRRGFELMDDLTPIDLDGESAHLARYAYNDETGQKVTEWAAFARHKDRAYYVQYASRDADALDASQITRLLTGFRYGPSPEGTVTSGQLADSLRPYHDPNGRFSVLVPTLWPLVDRAQDGSTTTFSELGGAGYLTLFAQPGATGLTVQEIIASWKAQSERETGFELVHDLTPAPLAGHDGMFFEHRLTANADTHLQRRLHAIVIDDFLYAIALDYVASGFESRRETFDRIFASMTLTDDFEEASAPDELDVSREADISSEADASGVASATDVMDEEELADDDHVTFTGRILTRYPDATGQTISHSAAHAHVTIRAGETEFTTVTDERGAFHVSDLPPLGEGFYMITHIQGSLFGFPHVGVNLENLGFRPDQSNLVSSGTIILVMDEDFNIHIELSDVE